MINESTFSFLHTIALFFKAALFAEMQISLSRRVLQKNQYNTWGLPYTLATPKVSSHEIFP